MLLCVLNTHSNFTAKEIVIILSITKNRNFEKFKSRDGFSEHFINVCAYPGSLRFLEDRYFFFFQLASFLSSRLSFFLVWAACDFSVVFPNAIINESPLGFRMES
jgi:hypothetical protein